MATIARFQGGHLDGQDIRLDTRAPIQSYIETAAAPCTCGTAHPEPAPQTYQRVAAGYSGENHIIIYRLEEKRGSGS